MNIEQASYLATIVGAILIIPQVFIAVYSIVKNNQRERIKSTLDFYEEINQAIKSQKKEIKEKYGEYISREIAISIHEENKNVSEVNRVLNLYERLALGSNLGIYDLKTLNRISGKLLIENYERYKEYIYYRRDINKAANAWIEFERMVLELKKLREKG